MAISKAQAQKDGLLGGCPLMEDREKLDFETILGKKITVEDFAMVKTKKGEAYVITFKEYKKNYAWAGGCLKKYIEAYGEDFIGTKLIVGDMVKTSNGNDFRVFDIAD